MWGAEIRFSCCEAVFVDQSAEAISALDALCSRFEGDSGCRPYSVGWREVERSVRPVTVVMVDEDAECPLEMAAVEDK